MWDIWHLLMQHLVKVLVRLMIERTIKSTIKCMMIHLDKAHVGVVLWYLQVEM